MNFRKLGNAKIKLLEIWRKAKSAIFLGIEKNKKIFFIFLICIIFIELSFGAFLIWSRKYKNNSINQGIQASDIQKEDNADKKEGSNSIVELL